jgi:hypothetical protein
MNTGFETPRLPSSILTAYYAFWENDLGNEGQEGGSPAGYPPLKFSLRSSS